MTQKYTKDEMIQMMYAYLKDAPNGIKEANERVTAKMKKHGIPFAELVNYTHTMEPKPF